MHSSMFLFHRHCSASSLCLAVSYLMCGARFACLSHTPFYEGYKHIGKRTSLSGVVRSVVRLKSSDAAYSYPAENSAPQGKREPLASTAIRDRINSDSRPTWRAYMLQFEPHSLSLNRLFVLILYFNLSRKSKKLPLASIADCPSITHRI